MHNLKTSSLQLLVSFSFLLSCAQVLAKSKASTSTFKQNQFPKASVQESSNLIRESEKLSVLGEKTVQTVDPRGRRVYAFSSSFLTVPKIQIQANDRIMSYDSQRLNPAVAVQYAYLPFSWRGQWGLGGMTHYTLLTQNQNRNSPTALHWTGLELQFLYRYEIYSSQWLIPSFGVGGGTHFFVQRGTSELDSSEAEAIGFFNVGLSINLSRAFSLSSPLQWGLLLQYKQYFLSDDAFINLNGTQMNLGLELSL